MNTDVQCLRDYETACKGGTVSSEDFTRIMGKASASAQDYSKNIKEGAGSAQIYADKQKALQSSIQNTGTASKVAAVVVKALSIAGNMLARMAISFAISKVIEGVNYLSESAERAKKKLEEIQTELSDNNSTYQSNRETLVGLKDEYESLSEKAESLGGAQNLANDEYERYQEIMSQILGITPKLTTGWNDEGKAISNKNNLLQQSIDLLDEEYEKSLRKNTTKSKNGEVAKGVIAKVDEFNNNSDTRTRSGTTHTMYTDFAEELKNVDAKRKDLNDWKIANQIYKYLYPKGDGLKLDGSADWIESLKNEIIDNKDYDKLAKSFIDKNNPIYELFSDEVIDDMIENADAYFDEGQRILDDRETLYQDYKDQLNWNAQAVADDSGQNAYKQLSGESKPAITEYINNLDYGSIKTEDDFIAMANDVKLFTKTLASDDTFADYINDIYAPQGEDESIEYYSKRVNDAIANVQKYIKDKKLSISLDFGTEDNPKGIKESVDKLQKQYDQAINKFEGKANDLDLSQFFKDNSINDQEEIDYWNKVTEGATSASQAVKMYNKAKEGETNKTPVSFPQAWKSMGNDTKQKLLDAADAGELTGEKVEELADESKELKSAFESTGMSADKFAEHIREIEIDNIQGDINECEKALQKMRNGQSLSSDETAELISKNSSLAGAIKKTKDGYKIEEDALISVMNTSKQKYNVVVSNEILETNKVIDAINKRISAYKTELKAVRTAMTARQGQYDTITSGGTQEDTYGLSPDETSRALLGNTQASHDYSKSITLPKNIEKDKKKLKKYQKKLKELIDSLKSL